VSLAGAFAAESDSPFGPYRAIFGVAAILISPPLYGCVGFLVGLIGA
jgi:hypothetical protein